MVWVGVRICISIQNLRMQVIGGLSHAAIFALSFYPFRTARGS